VVVFADCRTLALDNDILLVWRDCSIPMPLKSILLVVVPSRGLCLCGRWTATALLVLVVVPEVVSRIFDETTESTTTKASIFRIYEYL
jgi:hypothetical protein